MEVGSENGGSDDLSERVECKSLDVVARRRTCLAVSNMEERDLKMIFDSLPYIDRDLENHPILQEKVQHELAKELSKSTSLHPDLPPPFELFKVRFYS